MHTGTEGAQLIAAIAVAAAAAAAGADDGAEASGDDDFESGDDDEHWLSLCVRALKLHSQSEDAEALRLLSLPGADLWSALPHSEWPWADGQLAGGELARISAGNGRTRVLHGWLSTALTY